MLRYVLLLAVLLTIPVVPSAASAAVYQTPDGYVVHTRRLPVIIHRVSPPFHGRHIYYRRAR